MGLKTTGNFLLPLFLITLSASACFRVGLPEYYSNQLQYEDASYSKLKSLKKITKPTLVLQSDYKPLCSNQTDVSLGHQYLFIFLPFSTLYLQNGIDEFVREETAEHLAVKGYEVFFTNSTEVRPFDYQLQIKTDDFSLTAYDALFFRIQNISGNLQWLLSQNGVDLLTKTSEISKRNYKSSASPAELFLLLETQVRNLLINNFPIADKFAYKSSIKIDDSILILKPHLPELKQSDLQMFSESYGFKNVIKIGPENLARTAQKGIEDSLFCKSRPGFSYFGSVQQLNDSQIDVNTFSKILDVKINQLELQSSGEKEGISLDITFSLLDLARDNTSPLKRVRCEVFKKLITKKDGSWLLTLRTATAEAAEYFLTNKQPREMQISCE